MEPIDAKTLIHSADRPLIIAHRGNSSETPENTLAAFESAVKLKPDFIELDYRTTADGMPVVIHDKVLDRTTNALKLFGGEKLAVSAFKYEQIKDLDTGSWFNAKFADSRLATLEQALDVIQAGSMTMIEHKAGDAKTCVDLLHKKQYADRVIVQSFDWKFVTDVHKLDDSILLGALGDKELTAEKLDQIAKTGAMVVGWNQKHVGDKEIKLIHERGFKAWVYTVDDVDRAKELIEAGIDGIISNRPAAMLKLRGGL